MFAPTIGFAGLLRSLDIGSYSVPMVSGSEGSAGSGVSRSSLSLLPSPRVSYSCIWRMDSLGIKTTLSSTERTTPSRLIASSMPLALVGAS